MKDEMKALLATGVWRPAWFVAFLSSGSVLMVIGSVWAIADKRDGFYLMTIAVALWGSAAIMLAIFSQVRPKPRAGHRR